MGFPNTEQEKKEHREAVVREIARLQAEIERKQRTINLLTALLK